MKMRLTDGCSYAEELPVNAVNPQMLAKGIKLAYANLATKGQFVDGLIIQIQADCGDWVATNKYNRDVRVYRDASKNDYVKIFDDSVAWVAHCNSIDNLAGFVSKNEHKKPRLACVKPKN
jgi:hypothetical protein